METRPLGGDEDMKTVPVIAVAGARGRAREGSGVDPQHHTKQGMK
jgi:hypothetical protein